MGQDTYISSCKQSNSFSLSNWLLQRLQVFSSIGIFSSFLGPSDGAQKLLPSPYARPTPTVEISSSTIKGAMIGGLRFFGPRWGLGRYVYGIVHNQAHEL